MEKSTLRRLAQANIVSRRGCVNHGYDSHVPSGDETKEPRSHLETGFS